MEKYLKIQQFAKRVGRNIQNLRYLDSINVFKPAYISKGGHRFYTEAQVAQFFKRLDNKDKKNVFYALLDDETERKILIKNIKKFMQERNLAYNVIIDIRKHVYEDQYTNNIYKLLKMIHKNEVSLLYAFKVENFKGYPCLKLINDFAKDNGIKTRFMEKERYAR